MRYPDRLHPTRPHRLGTKLLALLCVRMTNINLALSRPPIRELGFVVLQSVPGASIEFVLRFVCLKFVHVVFASANHNADFNLIKVYLIYARVHLVTL